MTTRRRNHMDCWSGGQKCLLNDPTCPMAPVTVTTRAEDMDRDEEGHLTDLGREQLVEWHRLVGLVNDQ